MVVLSVPVGAWLDEADGLDFPPLRLAEKPVQNTLHHQKAVRFHLLWPRKKIYYTCNSRAFCSCRSNARSQSTSTVVVVDDDVLLPGGRPIDGNTSSGFLYFFLLGFILVYFLYSDGPFAHLCHTQFSPYMARLPRQYDPNPSVRTGALSAFALSLVRALSNSSRSFTPDGRPKKR